MCMSVAVAAAEARTLTQQQLQRMKVAELHNLCERMQLDVPDARRKQPYIDAVRAWQQQQRVEVSADAELQVSM